MNKPYRCGCERTPGNTIMEYGYQRCRRCKNAANRRSQNRRRARFVAEHGSWNAVPNQVAA